MVDTSDFIANNVADVQVNILKIASKKNINRT